MDSSGSQPAAGRRVLLVHYSQTGQLTRILDSIAGPVRSVPGIHVDEISIQPKQDFPFPWPVGRFFRVFPECVYLDAPEIEPITLQPEQPYDLVILAYQVWFLSPSLPTTAFLQSDWAARHLRDTPVMTVIGCRNMWLNAQETVKSLLSNLGAKLVDNVVLVDAVGTGASFLSTPLWMFTGQKQSLRWVPAAGVAEQDIQAASRFGKAIAERLLQTGGAIDEPMLKGMRAVKVEENTIASERIGYRSFRIWGRLIRMLGPQDSPLRIVGLSLYIVFLLTMICTVVPLNFLVNRLLYPLRKNKLAEQRRYFALPSGE